MLRAVARRHRRNEAAEMNVTAFMNLMVILVPFLLITAVFSRLTILQLNLPGESTATAELQQTLNLEVIATRGEIVVADRGTGVLRTLPDIAQGRDLKGLAEYLQLVKSRFPEKTDITVLLQPDTVYDEVVQVMDAVRAYTTEQDGKVTQAELFPDISIGDAPI
jgi:biopolymer transport protein ExbD